MKFWNSVLANKVLFPDGGNRHNAAFGFRMHGIYYDDPNNLEDPTKLRFILGFDIEENLT